MLDEVSVGLEMGLLLMKSAIEAPFLKLMLSVKRLIVLQSFSPAFMGSLMG